MQMNLYRKLKGLFLPMRNCEAAATDLCQALEFPTTWSNIKTQLEQHPHYPSLLAIGDVLRTQGINTIAGKIDAAKLTELPLPFLVHIDIDEEQYFTVVTDAVNGVVTYKHPLRNKTIKASLADFSDLFTGYVLIPEEIEATEERDYHANKRKENKQLASRIAMWACVPFLVLTGCTITLFREGPSSLAAIGYSLATLAGLFFGSLLLWYDLDQSNPSLKKICQTGAHIDCGKILRSKASKLFGISWSVIGCTYFGGVLLSLLYSGISHPPTLLVLSIVNLAALPYIFYSVHYQLKVAKQICVLCLSVLAMLALQFAIILSGGFLMHFRDAAITFGALFPIVFSFGIVYFLITLLLFAFRGANKGKSNVQEWGRLKYRPEIFKALLSRQKCITESTEGLGITIGNLNAEYRLIKVCNPYCQPCASSHLELDRLVRNNPKVSLQIIFSPSAGPDKSGHLPISHFLALAQTNNNELLGTALNDWYFSKSKEYNTFSEKFPVKESLIHQQGQLDAMRAWCDKEKVQYTPTFYINKFQIPPEYDIGDLKYILAD